MNQQFYYNKNGGYVALISSIVISLILTGLAFTVARAGFYSRFDSLNSEYKRVSKGLAESCINQALLELAQDPTYSGNEPGVTVGSNTCDIGAITFNPVSGYDSAHKKVATVFASADYKGSYSTMQIDSVIYDPQFAPPSKVALRVYSYGENAKDPNNFGPFEVKNTTTGNSKTVTQGEVTSGFDAGAYEIIEGSPDTADYDTTASGDCSLSGSQVIMDLGTNDYKTCNIIHTIRTQTAKLNIIISSADETMPTELKFGADVASMKTLTVEANQILEVDASYGIDSTSHEFTITASGIDSGPRGIELVGPRLFGAVAAGKVNLAKGDNKVCAIAINKKPAPAKVALAVATQVINTYGGTKIPGDFTADVTASGMESKSDTVAGETRMQVYYIDPADFEVTQQATAFPGYKTPQYRNTGYPYLCKCKASEGCTVTAGQSYLCVITNSDMPTSFTLTAAVNVTRAYDATPEPNFDVTLNSMDGHHYDLGKGGTLNNLPTGTYTVGISGTGDYSVSRWGAAPDCRPVAGNDKQATIAWNPLDAKRVKSCLINIVENPPLFNNIDTVMMLDRTGSMFTNENWIGGERTASKSFLDLYSELPLPRPQVGIGVFANDSNTSAQIAGTLTSSYGSETVSPTSAGPNTAGRSCTGSGCQNQWNNPDNGRNIDSTFATDSTNGDRQDYYNYGFSVPGSAAISGIEVVADGFVSASPVSTATLYPNGQGYYTSWTNGEAAIDETGAASCSSGDYIYTGTANNRESVLIDLSSVPVGATITSVDVTSYDRGDTNPGGTYKTFARLNGTNSDAGTALTASGTSGCNAKTQTIDVADTVKAASTALEIGVVKVSGNNSTVRVGAIHAVVKYMLAGSGSGTLSISLSYNGGNNWTSPKTVALTGTEAEIVPAGNGPADNWERNWSSGEFTSTNFRVRVRNDSASGTMANLNYIKVKVNYSATVATGLYLAVNNGLANTHGGTDISAAITRSYDELNSSRHIATRKKFLILLSDGEPTLPNGSGRNLTQGDIDAAYAAADAAKVNKGAANDFPVEIYTIHFGEVKTLPSGDSSRDLLAKLATGNVANGTHQPGSRNDVTNPTDTTQINAENNDGDHFFIVSATADPTAEMVSIFNKIGQQIIEAEAPPTATTGTLNIITRVINNSGDHHKGPSDFAVTISGANPAQTLAGQGAPGITLTLNPGAYNVDEALDPDYVETLDPQCDGTLIAGEEVTCTIINDDSVPSDAPPLPTPVLPPPSTSNPKPMVVVISQTNNASLQGSKSPSDFTIATDNPAGYAPFAGSDAGSRIEMTPGSYNIDDVTSPADPSYTISRSTDCASSGGSGPIADGQTRACVIVYTAIPPSPPAIETQQNIDINSWQEK